MVALARWDIFCSVVDNFGDVGVCWRLARQLAADFGLEVRLWIDDLSALHRIWPEARIDVEQQRLASVTVRRWPPNDLPFTSAELPDVVIEAFACELPMGYRAAMTGASVPPVWVNLDYLTAESWIEGCHGLASQVGPLQRYFFFPGFTPTVGGLLREHDLLAQRDRFDATQQQRFLDSCGIARQEGERLLSLFSYETASLGSLVRALRASPTRWRLIVPEGRALAALEAVLGSSLPPPGSSFTDGGMSLQRIDFLRQDDYDRLLWCCDFNIVRGEDSFVRAQWAARPLLWHIYPQGDDAHKQKLDAFLDRYLVGVDGATADLVRRCWRGWSAGESLPLDALLTQGLGDMTRHAGAWAAEIAAEPDLATQLVRFCATKALGV